MHCILLSFTGAVLTGIVLVSKICEKNPKLISNFRKVGMILFVVVIKSPRTASEIPDFKFTICTAHSNNAFHRLHVDLSAY